MYSTDLLRAKQKAEMWENMINFKTIKLEDRRVRKYAIGISWRSCRCKREIYRGN